MRRRLFTKKFSKEKIARFFDKEGFYVVVFLCVAIIATTAVYVTRNNMDYFSQGDNDEIAENYDDHEYYQPEDIEPGNEEESQQVVNTEDDEEEALGESQEESAAEEEEEQEETTDKSMIPENATQVMSTNTASEESNGKSSKDILNKLENPVELTSITMDFSYQSLPVFSITLDEYRSDHQGIDISAEKGTIVKAAMDGKVIDIVQDPRVGMLVTIDHGSGVMTKYGNLDKDVIVTKNQQVKCGDTLGKVGNTAMFEIEDEPHVHFEIWDGDKPVDPKDCIDDLKIEDSDSE